MRNVGIVVIRILEYREGDCERGVTTTTTMMTMRSRESSGMGLSKTSITSKWDLEWRRLYTSGHARKGRQRKRERREGRRNEREGKEKERQGWRDCATRPSLKLLAIYLRNSPFRGSSAVSDSTGCTRKRI